MYDRIYSFRLGKFMPDINFETKFYKDREIKYPLIERGLHQTHVIAPVSYTVILPNHPIKAACVY